MAISAVSAVSYGNNYNNINFKGEKKKKHQKQGISIPISHKLAVPLAATVLAMTPMSSSAGNRVNQTDKLNQIELVDNTDDNGKIISQKHFTEETGKNSTRTVDIQLVNTRGSGNTFDKIIYDYTVASPYIEGGIKNSTNPITAYSDITYELISDDGSKGPSFNIKSINIADNEKPTFVKDEEIEYIEKAINSPENKSDIQVHKYTRKLRHSGSHIENVSKGNIMKDAVTESEKVLGKYAGCTEFETLQDKYKISYYSKDDNMDDAEFVTVKKGNGPELRLISVEMANVEVNPYSNNPTKFSYGYVITTDGKNLYNLFDDNLVAAMLEIFSNKAIENAKKQVSFFSSKSQYMTTSKGVIMHVADVDD